ncbi:MAG: translation elongation factor 4 [Patescibacteria group bacterium]|jgi:GTP-binding protein LepA
MNVSSIRNFAIIAHVDHGKSTLADRLLELTHVVTPGKHDEQLLDRNPISRERGITIKLAPVTMKYRAQSKSPPAGEAGLNVSMSESRHLDTQTFRPSDEFTLNLVDTPGHVDFSYEVERTLACVEGVILLVDATQGIQAQTIAHAYKALEQNLTIIPVVNKIDMENAQVDKTIAELVEFLGVKPEEVYKISAKTGIGVQELLDAVIEQVPPPSDSEYRKSNIETLDHTKCLIFDSYYDPHRGVIAFARVFNGEVKKNTKLWLQATQKSFDVMEVGIFTPDLTPTETLEDGQIGYIVTNLKDIHDVQVGDTLSTIQRDTMLSGYRKVKPMVYGSVFPTDPDEYIDLKKSLEKLYLNDAALTFEPIFSKAMGGGFRIGFLGLLHADVTRERLEREFEQSLVLTPPKVEYENHDGTFYEPFVSVTVVTPQPYMGGVMQLCEESRASYKHMDNKNQIILVYEMPLVELIGQFFDRLKSITSGYASLDWEFLEYRPVQADYLEILLNLEPVEEFSEIVVHERAFERARELTKKIHEIIPRQQYEVKIQARYKGKIIASERVAPFRKDVTAKLYGGDRTRKDKLLNKQKKGKKLMKNIGKVEIPKEAFIKLFKTS